MTVRLGGPDPIQIADLVAVARDGRRVEIAPEVEPLLLAARAVVDAAASGDAPVYGLTTGLGAAVDTRLLPDDVAAFQARAVLARAVAVGPALAPDEVRATLFVRLCGLVRGASGISPGLPAAIAAMLNRRMHPIARRIGTLGEADLAILAGLFLPFAGGGFADLDGARLPGPEAVRRAGIMPPPLGPKDGIALINASAFSAGLAGLAAEEAGRAFRALGLAAALSLEAFRANLSPFDPRATALRPAAGQAEAADALLKALAGSDLFEAGRARRVQDPLSFRCIAPVHGVVGLRLGELTEAVECELNGAGDSPAVLPGTGEMLSTVNFDTTALALGLEAAGQALSHAAALAAARVTRLMSPAVSGLPRFLAPQGGSRTGYATAGKTAAALEAEIRRLAVPVGPMVMPVADGIEDHAPMTAACAEKLRAIAARLARLAAVELAVAAAGCDLRPGIRLGRGTAHAYRFVRERVAPLDEDRATGDEFEALALAIEDGLLERGGTMSA